MRNIFKIGLVITVLVMVVVASSVARKYRSTGDIWLGITNESVDRDFADDHDLSIKYGVYVHRVYKDSPAREAGLKKGDVIITLEDEKITDSDDLIDALEDFQEGDEVTLVVMRDDDKLELKAVLEDRPTDKRKLRLLSNMDEPAFWLSRGSNSYIGVSLSSLSRQLGEYFGVEKGRGALITEVEKDSPAEKAGLKAGDVIVSVDNETIHDVEDVVEEIREREVGDKVNLIVLRNKKEMKFEAEVDEREDDPSYGNVFYWDNHGLPCIPDIPSIPEIQEIDIRIPKLHGRHYDNDDFEYFELDFDRKELDRDMRELRKELKELERELRNELKEINLKLD